MTSPDNWRHRLRDLLERDDADDSFLSAYAAWASRHERANVILGYIAAGAFGLLCGIAIRW